MSVICPKCHQSYIDTKDTAKMIVGTVGMAGGAASGIASVLAGAQTGSKVGMVGGPTGMTIGTIAGAIIGGVIGAGAVGVTGAQVGSVIDELILNNYVCLSCGHEFSLDSSLLSISTSIAS